MAKKQLELNLDGGRHGGRRKGSGRMRIHSKGVAHRSRESVAGRTPLHINFKYKVLIKNKHGLQILKGAIMRARTFGLRVIHFSLQSNHVHLIVEAQDNEALSSGMRSLTVTLAKRVGRGKIQMGRYHLHVLKTIREAKNAIHYVLFNEQKHGHTKVSRIDAYSSLLAEKRAFELIRRFSKFKKVTLIVEKKTDYDELSQGKSFLLCRAWEQLISPV